MEDDEEIPDELIPMSPLEEVLRRLQHDRIESQSAPDFVCPRRTHANAMRVVHRNCRICVTAGTSAWPAWCCFGKDPPRPKESPLSHWKTKPGPINLVLFAAVWQRFFRVARTSNAWLVDGKLENRKGVIHVIVGRITDLAEEVQGLTLRATTEHAIDSQGLLTSSTGRSTHAVSRTTAPRFGSRYEL